MVEASSPAGIENSGIAPAEQRATLRESESCCVTPHQLTQCQICFEASCRIDQETRDLCSWIRGQYLI